MEISSELDLNNLIINQIEESIHLDYKRGNSLAKTSESKKEIAKDISAFANSDGGLIIYGIDESNHVASSYIPVDGNVITKEWLEQVINSNISRRINEIIITPIRLGGDITRTVYVVNIPKSRESPHMTSDKKFYRRFNFESVQMEEFEIRDLYNRTNATNLEILDISVEALNEVWSPKPRDIYDKPEILLRLDFHLAFEIENTGNSIETLYKLEVESDVYFYHSHEPYNPIKQYFIRNEGAVLIYSIPNSSPIFQNEKTTIIRASFTLDRNNYMRDTHKMVKCRIYYSSGVKERTFYLHELVAFSGKDISSLFL